MIAIVPLIAATAHIGLGSRVVARLQFAAWRSSRLRDTSRYHSLSRRDDLGHGRIQNAHYHQHRLGSRLRGGCRTSATTCRCRRARWPGVCAASRGMLPDLDSGPGVPLRESVSFAAAVVPMLMIEPLRADGPGARVDRAGWRSVISVYSLWRRASCLRSSPFTAACSIAFRRWRSWVSWLT